jgi:iron complex outermembrane receptor protein
MPTRFTFLIAAFLVLPVAVASDGPADEKESLFTEEVQVHEEPYGVEIETLDPEEVETGRIVNMGLALETLDGVAGVRRAQNMIEPVVRGLGWERVQTQVNGMPLYGACPGRMDPPAAGLSAFVREATLVRGLSSVTLGPAGTGGRLLLETDADRGPDAGRELQPWIFLSGDGARDGYAGSAGLRGGTDRLDFSLGAEVLDHGDYQSANGTKVPGIQEEAGGFASLGYRSTKTQRWNVGAVSKDSDRVDYPSLPMDSLDHRSRLYNAGYAYVPVRGDRALSEITARAAVNYIDHTMGNQYKPNWPMMHAETRTEADAFSVGASARWNLSPGMALDGGADFNGIQRDALRERTIVANGMTAYDHLWPDVSQDDLGLFAEHHATLGSRWHLRTGVRYDRVSSDAAAADDPSLGGKTVRENYVRFYGPEAADTDRDEDLVTANFVATRQVTERLSVQAGIGQVERAAGMSERYFAFAPAPGGYVVGNPRLDAESKREISAGAVYRSESFDSSLSLYYYDFADYIYSTVLERRDLNGDGKDDPIRGFFNVPATLSGGEVSVLYRATPRISVPAGLAYVRAQSDETDEPLPEIPPLELRAAARLAFPGNHPSWIELGGSFVDRQDRIDESFGENETPGFSVWHLRGRYSPTDGVALQVGVENLFDKEYNLHLTREALLAVGDLMPGDEVPQPGRSVTASVRWDF